ncbi:SPFH domain-containing protein [Blattabacterium cuenoti]|uniref:SPFH domain-containing protein n=1 Tax=Blattabacterium cuenoti TaxID=1653831 RepID=UPI00163C37B5|nr:SPFH domain-containing protein [Blattabacterium cuenoti]
MSIFSLLFYGTLSFFVFSLFSNFFFIVHQETAIIVERMGKYHSIRKSGLNFKIPFIDHLKGKLTLKIQQLDVLVDTKTKDNVFVKVKVSVQYRVLPNKVYDAFYRLDHPNNQIKSYIFDVVRAEVPKMRLDDLFERKDHIALVVKSELKDAMLNYGYSIINALVTDLDPDEQVKKAMNRINTAEREKVAAEYKAEADKIQIIMKAKAEAESIRLRGKGTADQRKEIAKGTLESIKILNNVGLNLKEASSLIIVTQHYDTLQAIGDHGNTSVVLIPNHPTSSKEMLNDMITSFHLSNKIGSSIKKSKNKKTN